MDAAVADHGSEAGEAGQAMGADAVAVGFGVEAGAQGRGGGGDAEVEDGAVEGGFEVGVGDAEHVFRRDGWRCFEKD